jgi:hypothetical protein
MINRNIANNLMAAVNDAKSLRKKEDELNDLAVAYGVQQNLLIALKNLNENPPNCFFDIGLPPYNHQSHLWDTDCKEMVLHSLAKELGMEIIANDSIEIHVFHRMYSHDNTLQILNKTISELIGRGFEVGFHSLFGFNLDSVFEDGQEGLENKQRDLLQSIDGYLEQEKMLAAVLANFEASNLENEERNLENEGLLLENDDRCLGNIEMLYYSVTHICSEQEIPTFRSYERAPEDFPFIPNMGLTITF